MDWKPTAKLETYQDVKVNLAWYTSVLLLIIFILGCFFLFGETFVEWLRNFKDRLSSIIGSTISMITVSFFVGWILVFLFEIHDKIYDRYVIRWRYYYTLDFLLPYLTKPIANRLDKSFWHKASQNIYEFMKPFYVFVGDGEDENRINKNLRVRFYERIMKYWITQINEIVLFLCFIAIIFFTYMKMVPYTKLTYSYITIILFFLVNRLFIRFARDGARQTTMDEIEEIHKKFLKVLNEEFSKLHDNLGMTYDKS